MFRFIAIAVSLVLFLVFSAPFQWMLHKQKNNGVEGVQAKAQKIVRKLFGLFLKMAGASVTVKGLDNIPDRSVLFAGNHRGSFDILLGYHTVPHLTGFVAKKEMEKIPLLSGWMRLLNCLFLDRKNVKEGLKTILSGIDLIKNGTSIFIFPEGTRNTASILELLEFKEGSLKIAEKGKCPIIPVAIIGSAKLFEKQFPKICPAEVTIVYGEPIEISELSSEDKKRLGAYTRERIIEMIKKEIDN